MKSPMYLREFKIRNFRCIESLDLTFNKGVNVFIGENNSGKSSMIDALRICLGYGKQWRDIGIRPSDFHIDKDSSTVTLPEIEFDLHFHIEDDSERGLFNELLFQDKDNVESQEIQIHFRYRLEEKNDRKIPRWKIWGGTNEGQGVPSEPLQFIDYTFLDALRDATQKLRPYSHNNKLVSLFESLLQYTKDGGTQKLDKEKKKELADKLVNWLNDDGNDWKYLIAEGETKVNKHFKESSIQGDNKEIEVGFSGYEYDDIINNLQLQIPILSEEKIQHGAEQRYFTLFQNGLGENNLIYAATVLGDLINRKEKGYYHALLIEEPEAHLHPQMQNTFFKYINSFEDKDIQIFITSHSPTITAKTNLEFITVMRRNFGEVSSLALKDSNLSPENRKYLSKFLDVTKSQLFFSKGIILVEGISEGLLLPIFSKIMDHLANEGKDDGHKEIKYDIARKGIEVVVVGGVAFEHFANLFIASDKDGAKKLNIHCALLTDDDSHRNGGNKSPRALIAESLKKGNVDVLLARKTFEYELFTASDENEKIMREIYEGIHTHTKLKREGSNEERAMDLLDKLDSFRDKSELAHKLAMHLQDHFEELRSKFIVPDYIQKGIKWAVNDK
jgi:putative ATP-dependent endonuclease of OLD family